VQKEKIPMPRDRQWAKLGRGSAVIAAPRTTIRTRLQQIAGSIYGRTRKPFFIFASAKIGSGFGTRQH
jgi:hypothetical protein